MRKVLADALKIQEKQRQAGHALVGKFVILYSSLLKDGSSGQREPRIDELLEVGRSVLEAAREDEPSFKAKLLECWATMIRNVSGIGLAANEFRPLFCLLQTLTDLDQTAEYLMPVLKGLSLQPDELALMEAALRMFEIAKETLDELDNLISRIPVQQTYWNLLPTVRVWCIGSLTCAY